MGLYVCFNSGFRWVISVVLCVLLTGSVRAQLQFQPPIQGPWSLSGTFGELRNNHFHAGLDFKTGGKEGLPILATADGCLSRIRQGPAGYGLALYIDHDSLYTSVYAHLHHADPGISAFLDSLQWANRRFEIDTAVPPGRFCFRGGEVVGVSGNSGSSEGPHLHFEIRDLFTQEPLNPLSFLPGITDTVPPLIQKIVLYKRIENRFVRDSVADCTASAGDTVILSTGSSECAIGLVVNDPERLGIYGIDWSIDSAVRGGFRFDRFSFNETRYANAHSDRLQGADGSSIRVHRLFRLTGDSCSLYKEAGQSTLKFDTVPGTQVVRVVCFDAHGNRDSVVVRVVYSPEISRPGTKQSEQGFHVLVFGQELRLPMHGGSELILTPKALYQDQPIDASLRSIMKGELVYHPVMPELAVQFHEPQTLILPVPHTLRKTGQELIAIRSDSAGGKVREVLTPVRREGHLADFKIRSGGWYALSEDRVPPMLDVPKQQFDEVDSTVYMQCRITEEGSGLARYEVKRNHRWILAEYDAKSGRLRWKPESAGQGPDLISIVLEDKCGNTIRMDMAESLP